MQILLDEDVPVQVCEILSRVLIGHGVKHVNQLQWKSKKDRFVYRDAADLGFDAIVTNDAAQLFDPVITKAIKRSGLHYVHYTHEARGVRGLALACGAIIAAMPGVVAELEAAPGQRIVEIKALATHDRYKIKDPMREPPRYWR